MADESDQQQQQQEMVEEKPEENVAEEVSRKSSEEVIGISAEELEDEEDEFEDDEGTHDDEEEKEAEQPESEDEEIGPAACRTNDSEDDKYKEYKQIVKQIKCQNEIINNIKKSIIDIIRKPCNTNCEKTDLKEFLKSMDCEMTRLRDLINKAMNLQNFGSSRYYKDIELATSFDEDKFS